QWRGIGRDSKVTGFKAPSSWPNELKQGWKVTVGFGDATPVLTGNKIYLNTRQGNEEMVICLEAATGKELWKYSYATPAVTGPSTSHPGPRSTPSVANGKIVTFGVSGIISCLDAASGKLIWKKEDASIPVPQFFTGMSPLVADGMCILQLGGKDNGQVFAYDVNTGNEKWKWTGEGPAYASPSVLTAEKTKQVVLLTEKRLIGLNMVDGKLLWQVATAPLQRFYNSVSPYIDGQTIYYTGQGAGMKAIRVERSGNEYVTKELWSNAEVGAKWSTPVLKDGFLYGFTDQKRIFCLNATTGQTAWIDNAVNSDFAAITDCGSVIIGLPSTANLIVFKPESKAYTELARYKVSETPIYAFPVISGSTIYIKDAETLTLFKLN
ncbi:MAG TPA: PQQ-binding-like beta-propeller repeat protein, partial [Anaerovoracaceae bacterium]|nr:PQQ-binding-like beta-propeller repeat protein [Anaerovoracaceae bacterium]